MLLSQGSVVDQSIVQEINFLSYTAEQGDAMMIRD
jgi:hypothetical protein